MKTTPKERAEWRDSTNQYEGGYIPSTACLIDKKALLRLLDDADRCAELESEVERLREAADVLFHFVPAWAREVPSGLCPTMYGTGSYHGDLRVKEKVDMIAALLGDE